MGFRFRRSIRIARGVRLNLGKKGVSLSVGGKGATVNVSKRGVRGTAGIPGTGLSYSETLLGGRHTKQRSARSPAPATSGTHPSSIHAQAQSALQKLISSAYPALQTHGMSFRWPFELRVLAKPFSGGQYHWLLLAEDGNPQPPLEPGQVVLTSAYMEQTDTPNDVVDKLMVKASWSSLTSSPALPQMNPDDAYALKIGLVGAATLVAVIWVISVLMR